MANGWIFPRLAAATGGTGANYTGPLRIVVHTTETLSNPLNWVGGWASPSHCVADPYRYTVYQCCDFNYGAKALYNAAGGVQTNLEGALQVEINMRAVDPADPSRPDLSEAQYRWLAKEVFAPICRFAAEYGSPIDHNQVAEPGVIPNSARDTAPQRMAWALWEIFRGWCGHRNVPENDHWDAGLLNLHKLARYTAEVLGLATPTTSTTTTKGSDMPMLVLTDAQTVYVVGETKRPIIGAANWTNTAYAIKHLVDKGVVSGYVTGVELGSLSIIPDGTDYDASAAIAAAATATAAAAASAAAAAAADLKATKLAAEVAALKITLSAVLDKVNAAAVAGPGGLHGPVDVSGTLDITTRDA